MLRSLLFAILILPGTGLIIIPAIILWLSQNTRYAAQMAGPNQSAFWISLAAAAAGLCISVWTVLLFLKAGRGTPAPWNPPNRLVVQGPYRYVRNPMITSVLLIMISESLFFRSWPLAGWTIVFFAGNAIYFPLIEEKGLEKRFGDEYIDYRKNVPRWIPRLNPWEKPTPEPDI